MSGTEAQIFDFYEVADSRLREAARSTAIKVDRRHIHRLGDGTVRIDRIEPMENMCLLNNFRRQTRVPNTTVGGFLIAADTLLTVGHTINSRKDCTSFTWIFDYALDGFGQAGEGFVVEESAVYRCVEVLSREFFGCRREDFALIKLDRRVVGRKPLEIRRSGKVADDARLALIGYPNGLPLKIVEVENVHNSAQYVFYTSLSLPSFSGSPLIDIDTGLVEGYMSCLIGNSTGPEERKYMLYNEEEDCLFHAKSDGDPHAGTGIVGRTTNIR